MKKLIIILISFLSLSIAEAKKDKPVVNLENLEDALAQLEFTLSDLDFNLSYMTNIDPSESYSYEMTFYNEEQQRKGSRPGDSSDKDIFERLSNIKGVEVVFISKAMLGMMSKMDMPGVDIGNIAGKLESLQILSADNNQASMLLKIEADKLVRNKEYETLMYVKDDDSRTGFFVKKSPDNESTEMLMVTEDNGEVTLIRILGSFKLKDIQDIAKKQSKKKK